MQYYLNWSVSISVFWNLEADECQEFAEDLGRINDIATRSASISSRLLLGGSICFRLGVISFCFFALLDVGVFY